MAGYGTDDGFNTWMTANGYVLPAGSPSVAILRQRGSAYIDGMYGPRFSGAPVDPLTQERAWPRTGATLARYGTPIPDNLIPTAVIEASYFASFQEANAPGSLNPAATGAGQVKREKVDVIEVEYFGGSGDALADATTTIAAVQGLLAPFIATSDLPAIFAV